MKIKKRYTKKNKNKKLFLLAATALIALLGLVIWQVQKRDSSSDVSQKTDEPVNNSEPTAEDKEEAEQNKDRIVADQEDETSSQTNETSTSKKEVDVVFALPPQDVGSYVEASAYASTFEKTGTCTLTLTKGSKKVSTSRAAVPNVSTMSCGTLKIADSKLSDGVWTAKITYSSSKAEGSATEQVTVK